MVWYRLRGIMCVPAVLWTVIKYHKLYQFYAEYHFCNPVLRTWHFLPLLTLE
jgi:hypothetical protein